MATDVKRIILDTNLWISFLINKDFSILNEAIFSNDYVLIFSSELFEEFIEVVSRPKFKKYFSEEDIIEIIEVINQQAEFVDVVSEISFCRDKKDNFLLSLAIDGRVDYLITGDADLLELEKIDSVKILTLKEFVKELKQ